ncbi:MAG TPA: hypothetical protein VFM36_00640, partial [Thermoanaerobaculia bacterium]|nr:hypothetical protein [Thermoanaerobaculia bacterium]
LDTLARIQLDRGECVDAARNWARAIEAIPESRTKERTEMTLSMVRARQSCHGVRSGPRT